MGLASRKAWFAKQSGSRLPIWEWLGFDPKHFDLTQTCDGLSASVFRVSNPTLPRESDGSDFIQNEHIELPLKTFGGLWHGRIRGLQLSEVRFRPRAAAESRRVCQSVALRCLLSCSQSA